jgi:hypothetical protein
MELLKAIAGIAGSESGTSSLDFCVKFDRWAEPRCLARNVRAR